MSGWRLWARGLTRIICIIVVAAASAAMFVSPGEARGRHAGNAGNEPIPDKPGLGSLGAKLNANTIAVISGNVNAAWLTMAYDLSAVLDDGYNFRVLPVIGKGGAQNIRDVRYLKGVDLGFTVTTVLNKFRRTGELGDIADKIDYITRLSDHDMHVLVRADSGISSVEQLNGKKVNFSDMGSSTEVSARHVFQALGIKPIEVNMGQADAYEKMKSGDVAATIQFGAKPAPAIAKLRDKDGFRLLPIPYDKRLQDDFLPASLTSADYPGLIPKGQDINTIAYGAVLIAYNWPEGSDRYRRIAGFVDRFFSHFSEFQKPPRHPAWREVNLAADLPGWHRFPEAQAWIDNHRRTVRQSSGEEAAFDEFLAHHGSAAGSQLTPRARDALFQEFLQWNQERQRRQNAGG
jgi:uncharacterized protein